MRLRQKTVQPRKKIRKIYRLPLHPQKKHRVVDKIRGTELPCIIILRHATPASRELVHTCPASCLPQISRELNVVHLLQKCKITVCRPRISWKLNADTPRKPSTHIAQKPVCATPSPRHAAQKAPLLPALLRMSPMRRQSQRWDGYLS